MDHFFTHLFLFEYFSFDIVHLLLLFFLFGSGLVQNFLIYCVLLRAMFDCELLAADDLLVQHFFHLCNLSCFICLFFSFCLYMQNVTVLLDFTPLISRNVRG